MSLKVLLSNSFQWKHMTNVVECFIRNEFHNRIIIESSISIGICG